MKFKVDMNNPKSLPKLTAILIGAGARGAKSYAPYALSHPDELRFLAVAEPVAARREHFAAAHNIPLEHQFQSWEELLACGKIADCAIIATHDQLHTAPTLAALATGYDVLLEKPMASTLDECLALTQAAEQTGHLLQICHVLRFTPFFKTLHEIVASGRLGEIVTVEQRENVAYWHAAHSYVRGHWCNSQLSSPMILAKCCHDLDILYWNLGACRRLSSTGSLLHFRPENAPPGAPERCTDGCPAEQNCPFYAPRFYLDCEPLYQAARHFSNPVVRLSAAILLDYPRLASALRRMVPPFSAAADYRGWPIDVISDDTSLAARRAALESGPWGRCVYHCDNDVVDHQVVTLEFENGASGVLVMHSHSHQESRTIRYDGSRATLRARFDETTQSGIEIHDHRTGSVEHIHPETSLGGHGGGDEGIMSAFIASVSGDRPPLTTGRESLESHLMAFAAEQARIEHRVVELDAYRF
jgi:predicted dehydrogenase